MLISCIAGGFFTTEPIGTPIELKIVANKECFITMIITTITSLRVAVRYKLDYIKVPRK